MELWIDSPQICRQICICTHGAQGIVSSQHCAQISTPCSLMCGLESRALEIPRPCRRAVAGCAQEKVSAEAQAPTSDRWMDPGGYALGALNPNEALNCVDDINRMLLQVLIISPSRHHLDIAFLLDLTVPTHISSIFPTVPYLHLPLLISSL